MEPKILQTTTESAGERIDSFLSAQLEGVSRSAAARLLEQGHVLCDGKKPGKSYRLTGSETISVTLPEAADTAVVAQDIALDVVYEDDDVIVVNKPTTCRRSQRADFVFCVSWRYAVFIIRSIRAFFKSSAAFPPFPFLLPLFPFFCHFSKNVVQWM